MISIFFGPPSGVRDVQAALTDHGSWLGLSTAEASRQLNDDTILHCAWDPQTSDDMYRYLVVCPSATECRYDDSLDEISPRVRLHVHLAEGTLTVDVPISAAVQVQYAPAAGGWLLTDDLRLMRRIARPAVEPLGVYGLLKFGGIPAPYTLFAGVTRIGLGMRLAYDGRSASVRLENPWREVVRRLADVPRPASFEEARERVVAAFDRAIAILPDDGAVLFSGGVDSTFIAARLAAMGRTNVKLAHLEFSHLPTETPIARALAEHLGMEIVVQRFEHDYAAKVLPVIGREWPFPFSGASAVPTHAAVGLALSLGSKVVAEGAAGGFLAGAKMNVWKRRGRWVPGPVRGIVGAGLRVSGLWQRGLKMERLTRLAGRHDDLPAAVLYQVKNPLDGLAYRVPDAELARLAEAITAPLDGLPGDGDSTEALGVAGLTLRVGGRYVPKLLGPLSAHGASGLHPFTGPEAVQTELSSTGPWTYERSKPILKTQLAQQVPREYVYRKKSHFVPLSEDLLTVPDMRDAIEEAISPGSALAPFVMAKPVRKMLRAAERHGADSAIVRSWSARWLWTLAFNHIWLRDTDFG